MEPLVAHISDFFRLRFPSSNKREVDHQELGKKNPAAQILGKTLNDNP